MNTFLYNNIQISPAPQIDIEPEINYANNSIIGYTYTIKLTGKAIDENTNFLSTLEYIDFIKTTLSSNGSVLLLKDSDGNELIKAIGGILTSLEFEKTDNAWTKYANYTASIKFNEVNILGENFNCHNNVFPSHSFSSGLVDLNEFKLKEFSDEWTFNIAEDAYNFEKTINITNSKISVQYDISASADNYFLDNGEVIAGWQQSKNFVQQRLFDQIQNFKNKTILTLHGLSSCESSSNLQDLHNLGDNGLISSLSSYDICNETVTCSTSESKGNFSATYSATLKYNDGSNYSGKLVVHKVSKSITNDIRGKKHNITIKIDGTIEGLNSGSINSNTFGGFTLPKNGRLIIPGKNFDAYNNAKIVKDKIIQNDEDLSESFKQALGITLAALTPTGTPVCSPSVKPASFSLTTNEFLATINYSVTYTSDRAIAFENDQTIIYKTTIDVDSPNHVYAEFPIPNGDYVIQDLQTTTSKKIKVSVNARLKGNNCCIETGNDTINNITVSDIKNQMESYNLPAPTGDMIMTNKNIAFNLMDKTYTLNAEYICKRGCPI